MDNNNKSKDLKQNYEKKQKEWNAVKQLDKLV